MKHLPDRLRARKEPDGPLASQVARSIEHSLEKIRAARLRAEGEGTRNGGANDERIAFVVDSCCDVPAEYLELFPFFVAPMTISYDDGSTYLDGVDITQDEIYARFPSQIPHTSAPTPGSVHEAFAQAVAAGYTHIIGITIAAGLSASCMVFEQIACEFPTVKTAVIDTRNIGIGAGISAMFAAELLEAGCSFDEIVRETRAVVERTHVFFVVDTLEYLYRGGRIGAAVYKLGTTLNIRPIITCDESGRYVVCGKARGRKKSLAKAAALARESETEGAAVRIALVDGMAEAEKHALLDKAAEIFPRGEEVFDAGHVSPALVVHTGPGLIGIIVQSI